MIGQWLALNAPEYFRTFIFANTAAKIGNAEGWNQRIATVGKDRGFAWGQNQCTVVGRQRLRGAVERRQCDAVIRPVHRVGGIRRSGAGEMFDGLLASALLIEQQAKLGEQQRKIIEDATRQLKPMIEQAIRDGKGKVVSEE